MRRAVKRPNVDPRPAPMGRKRAVKRPNVDPRPKAKRAVKKPNVDPRPKPIARRATPVGVKPPRLVLEAARKRAGEPKARQARSIARTRRRVANPAAARRLAASMARQRRRAQTPMRARATSRRRIGLGRR